MADIFLSYAREDVAAARSLAHWLEQNGWSVWWDRKIAAGKTFDAVIAQELAACRCVLVLWTRHSVASDWVKEEASEAVARKILVPALLDDTPPPLGFKRIQAAQLAGWVGDPDDERLGELRRAISEFVRPRRSATDTPVDATPLAHAHELPAIAEPRLRRRNFLSWIVLPLLAVASMGIGFLAAFAVRMTVARDIDYGYLIADSVWAVVALLCLLVGYRGWRRYLQRH